MKILLTTDIFFHPPSHHPTYHKWILRLLATAMQGAEAHTEIDFIDEVLERTPELNAQLPREAYSPLTGSARTSAEQRLAEVLHNYQLVVAFEPSKEMRRWMATLPVRVVSLFIHPVRFHPDLLFSVETEDAALREALAPGSIADAEFHVLGRYWREVLTQRTPEQFAGADLAVIVGQTSRDMSVWDGRSMLTLQNIEDKIADIVAKHETVLYRGHPYDRRHNDAFLRRFPTIKSTHTTTYQLFREERVSAYALSSSMIEEARYFGHTGTYLWEPLFNADGLNLAMGKRLLSVATWKRVLDGADTPPGTEDAFVNNHDALLRNVRGVRWSYPYLREMAGLEHSKPNVKTRIKRWLRGTR